MRAYLRDEDRTDNSAGGDGDIGGGSGEMKHQQPHGRQMYMPSWHMESFLGPLATALTRKTDDGRERTTQPAFTLFILNPNRIWAFPGKNSENMDREHVTYGYRCGLSSSAMKVTRPTTVLDVIGCAGTVIVVCSQRCHLLQNMSGKLMLTIGDNVHHLQSVTASATLMVTIVVSSWSYW